MFLVRQAVRDGNHMFVLGSSRSRAQGYGYVSTTLAIGVLLLGGCAGGTSNGPQAEGNQKECIAAAKGKTGEAREKALYEGAKREGGFTWYTTLNKEQGALPLANAFEEKYSDVNVEIYRSSSEGIVSRILEEGRAGGPVSSVWSASNAAPIVQAGFAQKYAFPTASDFPDEYLEDGGHWAASSLYVFVPSYNTNRVSPSEVPRTYRDLLEPRFKGEIIWSASTGGGTGFSFIGNILATMGQDQGVQYLEELAQQNITATKASSTRILGQVTKGDYKVALQTFNQHAAKARDEGAPIGWTYLEPVLTRPGPTGLTKNGPDPCAGRLFMDFQLSPAGQKVLADRFLVPAHPSVPAKIPKLKPSAGNAESNFVTPAAVLKHQEEWLEVRNRIFG